MLSAFTNIGILPAAKHVTEKHLQHYLLWMEIYKAVKNPLVFFTDTYSAAKKIFDLRKSQQLPTAVSFHIIIPLYINFFTVFYC